MVNLQLVFLVWRSLALQVHGIFKASGLFLRANHFGELNIYVVMEVNETSQGKDNFHRSRTAG